MEKIGEYQQKIREFSAVIMSEKMGFDAHVASWWLAGRCDLTSQGFNSNKVLLKM